MNWIQASVSIKRLNKFMNADELDPESVSHETTGNNSSLSLFLFLICRY